MHEEKMSEGAVEGHTDRTERARYIACDLELVDKTLTPDALRFHHILDTLKFEDLLEAEVVRVKELFALDLGDLCEHMREDAWHMLTVLELFDPETARHCIDTYHIARSKIEETLFSGIVLADSFKNEGVGLTTFFTACLLHDIGKVEVPHRVLVSHVSDRACASLLYEHTEDTLIPALRSALKDETYILPESVTSPDTLLAYLHNDVHIRPQSLAPIRLLLPDMTESEQLEIEKQLSHCGRTLSDTLIDIMRTHDHYSRDILMSMGYSVEAEIAGAHHSHGTVRYEISVGALQVSVDLAELIHLADVEEAVTSARHYKREGTSLEALSILAFHAQTGALRSYVAYLWIADDMRKHHMTKYPESDEERTHYERITTFLDREFSSHPEYPPWRRTALDPTA